MNSSFCTSWANTNIRKERREKGERKKRREEREERTEKQINIPRTATGTAFVTLSIFAFVKLIR